MTKKKTLANTEFHATLDNPLFILSLFSLSFFIYRDFDIRMIYGFAALGLFFSVYFINHIFIKKEKPKITSIEALISISVLSVVLFFVLPNARKDADTIAYIIALLISFVFLLFSDSKNLNEKYITAAFIIGAIIFALYTLFFTAFTKLFYKAVMPYLSNIAKDYLIYYLKRGYAVTVGGSSYTEYILLFGIASSVATYFTTANKKIKHTSVGLITVFVITAFIIGRRGEFLACIISLFAFYLISRDKAKRNKELIILASIFLISAVLFIVFFKQLKEIHFLKRYIFTIEQILSKKDFSSGRGQLYSWALELFSKSPVYGAGWGGFARVITPQYQQIHGSHGGIVADAHNNFLQIFAETGILGFVFIVLPLIYIYALTISQILKVFRNKFDNNSNITKIKKLTIISFIIQTFFISLSFIDPCTYKIIFCCIYVIPIKFISISLELSNYEYNDFMSKIFNSLSNKLVKLKKNK